MNIKRISTYAGIAAIAFSLSACSTVTKVEDATPAQQDGMLIGGLAGATGGVLLGAPAAATILLAAIGTSVGYYLNTADVEASPITSIGGSVFVQGQYITITLPSDYLFEANSTTLVPGARHILKTATGIINDYKDENILVTANTDNIASKYHQYKLSVSQASKIAAFLWSNGVQSNMSGRKLSYSGLGSFNPIANNASARGATQNRHITIVIYPSKPGHQQGPNNFNIPAM